MDEDTLASNYDEAEEWCTKVVKSGHELLFDVDVFDVEMKKASKKFRFPAESLNSFLRNVHLKRVKKQTYVIKNQLHTKIIPEYMKGKSIFELAKIYNFPPAILSRSIIGKITNLHKKKISEAMRNPIDQLNNSSIMLDQQYVVEDNITGAISTHVGSSSAVTTDGTLKMKKVTDPFSGELIQYYPSDKVTRLAKEVQEAIHLDPLYGPGSDRERQIIGIEYEIILEQTLLSMKIPFETERELKKRGTSKTPDILFLCPVGIKIPKNHKKLKRKKSNIICAEDDTDSEWKMICWIDSKALFGDTHTHQKSVLPQAEGYVHRFGPGLVLYWFGHAPYARLDNGHGDVYVKGWEVPKEFMMPTGDIARVGGWTNTWLMDDG